MLDMAGSTAAPAARCRKFRRGSFIFEPPFTSFDYLVGAGEQCRWYGEAEHPGGLLVDDELELGRLHDRQIRRLCALEDATGIDAHLTRGIRQACSTWQGPGGTPPGGPIGRAGRRKGSCCRRRGRRVARSQASQTLY